MARRPSSTLPDCSYLSGLTPVDLTVILPDFVVERLIRGFRDFGRKMPGFLHPDAVVVAPATANLMARMAGGHAADLATTILLATTLPILIAPPAPATAGTPRPQ